MPLIVSNYLTSVTLLPASHCCAGSTSFSLSCTSLLTSPLSAVLTAVLTVHVTGNSPRAERVHGVVLLYIVHYCFAGTC